MDLANEVTSMRAYRKLSKETMVQLCREFGVYTTGLGKKQMAEILAEQLHYETDDEE